MASFNVASVLILFSIFSYAALGDITCENLPKDVCAFSIDSSGKRCLLETSSTAEGSVDYLCRTSEVIVEKMADYIETDECVAACGLDRNAVGISSDSLLEAHFTAKLCSPFCYRGCPNIVDLYSNLAAGEGAYLPALCRTARRDPHRSLIQLVSSAAAPGPFSTSLMVDPAPAPM